MGFFRELREYWRELVFFITPLVLLPLIFVSHDKIDVGQLALNESANDAPQILPREPGENGRIARCAYGLILMSVYWTTECIPFAATALVPMVVFPVLQVAAARDLAQNYLQDANMMFMGGLMMAAVVEESKLHKRIAIGLLVIVGTNPYCLLLGLMLSAWFVSLFISNTATTAMMLPVVIGVIEQLDMAIEAQITTNIPDNQGDPGLDNLGLDMEEGETSQQLHIQEPPMVVEPPLTEALECLHKTRHYYKKVFIAMQLGVAYAANCGGIATLPGTPPNTFIKGVTDELFAKYQHLQDFKEITYGTWLMFGGPISITCFIAVYFFMCYHFLGSRFCGLCCCEGKKTTFDVDVTGLKEAIKKQYENLGRISYLEICNIVMFVLLVIVWFTRKMEFTKNKQGWAYIFKHPDYITDTVPVIAVIILVMILPGELPKFGRGNPQRPPQMISWNNLCAKVPWGVIILLGGGFALAHAVKVSGLSNWIGEQLQSLEHLSKLTPGRPWLLILIISTMTAAMTELNSNTATITVLATILEPLAVRLKIHPLYLLLPATVSASFAFMLPIATPANAIVFSRGNIKVTDMIGVGKWLNVICIIIVTILTCILAPPIFELDKWQIGGDTNGTTRSILTQ